MTFGAIAAAIGAVGCVAYTVTKIRSRSELRFSLWAVWSLEALTGAIAYSASADGAETIWLFVVETISVFLIAGLALVFGKRTWRTGDLLAASLAVLTALVWAGLMSVGQREIACVFIFGVSLIGTAMFARDHLTNPAQEHLSTWVVMGIANGVNLLAVERFTFGELCFPLHDVVVCGFVVVTVVVCANNDRTRAFVESRVSRVVQFIERGCWEIYLLRRAVTSGHRLNRELAYAGLRKAAADW